MQPIPTPVDSPFVKHDSPEYWDRFRSQGNCCTYKARSIVYSQGETNDCLFYVRKGRVKITILNPDGAERILAVLGPGSLFGETFVDGFPHFASAIAVERSEILSFPKALIFAGIQSDPQVVFAFVMSVLRKLRLCALQIEHMTFRSAAGRIYHLLHQLCITHGVPCSRGRRIQFRITHQEIGQVTATSRITVNKVLNDLKRQGIIGADKRWIVVQDEETLARLAAEDEQPGALAAITPRRRR